MKNEEIKRKYDRISIHLDEKSRRLWCANEAISAGWGGVSLVSKATGVSRTTITEGIKEIKGKKAFPSKKIRRKGGGRKKKIDKDKTLPDDLDILIEPFIGGDPESPLRWVCKSTRKLSCQLKKQGHDVSHSLVARTLKYLDYTLQSNKKAKEGAKEHPDRNAQFHFIDKKIKKFQKKKQAAISVDTKKKKISAITKTTDGNTGKKESRLKWIFMILLANWGKSLLTESAMQPKTAVW